MHSIIILARRAVTDGFKNIQSGGMDPYEATIMFPPAPSKHIDLRPMMNLGKPKAKADPKTS